MICAVLVLACTIGLAAADVSPSSLSFAAWQRQYSVTYASDVERSVRAAIYEKNVQDIVNHNAQPDREYEMGINQFTDRTSYQFESEMLRVQSVKSDETPATPTATVTDDEWDWRAHDAVTPIVNQGSCGGEWAIGPVGAMESSHAIKYHNLTALSVQQIIDCSPGTKGCNGGNPDDAYKFGVEHGLCKWSDYPYRARLGQCLKNCTVAAYFESFTQVSKDDAAMLAAIRQHGPVTAYVDATTRFQSYKSGVLDGTCGTRLNHIVLLVGYGTDAGKPYWIAKNSWGTSWGEAGYIRIIRGKDMCGINQHVTYVVSK